MAEGGISVVDALRTRLGGGIGVNLRGKPTDSGTNNKDTRQSFVFIVILHWVCEPLGEAFGELGLRVKGLRSHGGDLGGHVGTRGSTWALLG